MLSRDILIEILSYGFHPSIGSSLDSCLVKSASSRITKRLPYRDSLYLLTSGEDLKLEDLCYFNYPCLLRWYLERTASLATLEYCLDLCANYNNPECLDVVLSIYPRNLLDNCIYYGLGPKLICVYAKYMKVDYGYLLRHSADQGYTEGVLLSLRNGQDTKTIEKCCLRFAVKSDNIECVQLLLDRSSDDIECLISYARSPAMIKFLRG